MKTYILIGVTLFCSTLLFGQSSKLSPEMNEPSADFVLFTQNDSKIVYRFKGIYSPFYENKYIVNDTKTGASTELEVEKIMHNQTQGFVTNYLIKNDKIYELLLFKATKTNPTVVNAIAIRDLNTLKQIGKIVLIDEISKAYLGAGQGLVMKKSNSGFYVMALNKYIKRHYVKHFSEEGIEDWTVELESLNNESVEVKNVNISDNDDVLISVTSFLSEMTNGKQFSWKDRGLDFLLIDKMGEVSQIAPSLEGELMVSAYDFQYYPRKKQIIGVLSTTKKNSDSKSPNSGIGYAYFAWDLDGSIAVNGNHFFSFNELDSPELQRFITVEKVKKSSLSSDQELPLIYMTNNSNLFFMDDGSCIVAFENFVEVKNGVPEINGDFANCHLIYCVSSEGEVDWVKFLPYDISIQSGVSSYRISNEKLYMYSKFVTNKIEGYSNELATSASTYESAKSLLVMERIFDVRSGEILEFKPVLDLPLTNYSDAKMYNRFGEDLVIEYHYSKKNKIRLAVIKR